MIARLSQGLRVGSSPITRTIPDGLVLAGLLFTAYVWLFIAPNSAALGADALAYWSVDLAHPYSLPEGFTGAFTYTPIMAIAFSPASLLPWPVFWWLWLGLLLGILVWLGRRKVFVLLAFPPVAIELFFGNVNLLIAAAIVLGFRYPAAWAFVAATKVTPVVGLAWFAARREWRALLQALAVLTVLVSISLVFVPHLWKEWLASLQAAQPAVGDGIVPIPLEIRIPVAIAVAAWGGISNRRWTVPVASTLALPAIWFGGLSILAAMAAVDRFSHAEAIDRQQVPNRSVEKTMESEHSQIAGAEVSAS